MSTEYPILILRSCFHVGALNSRALELLHINRDTVGHYGAFAEVDETGAPNGVVKENVLDDIKAAIPSVGLSPLMEQVVQSQHDLLAEGLTSIQSDDFKYAPDEEPYALMDGLRELAERGALKLRFAEQALLTEPETLEEFSPGAGPASAAATASASPR
ncbi:MAG: amidohydrolase family protein [Flavonifractor plautii]